MGYLPPAPMPPKRNNNAVLVVAIALLGVALIALVAALASPSRPTATETPEIPYQNEGYTAPPPDQSPPDLVYPDSDAQAKSLLDDNPLYQQTAPRPIRCEFTSDAVLGTATREQLQVHLDELTACLMKQWAGSLEAAGFIAVRPTVTIFEGDIQTACGKHESRNAFYCGADQQVYFAPDLATLLPPQVVAGRFTVDIIMAHEFGHAIQGRTGILISGAYLAQSMTKRESLEFDRRTELQADCLSGIFMGSIALSTNATPEDLANVEQVYRAFGDDTLSGKPDIIGNHGRADSRAYWGNLGITTNPPLIGNCNTWVVPSDQVI